MRAKIAKRAWENDCRKKYFYRSLDSKQNKTKIFPHSHDVEISQLKRKTFKIAWNLILCFDYENRMKWERLFMNKTLFCSGKLMINWTAVEFSSKLFHHVLIKFLLCSQSFSLSLFPSHQMTFNRNYVRSLCSTRKINPDERRENEGTSWISIQLSCNRKSFSLSSTCFSALKIPHKSSHAKQSVRCRPFQSADRSLRKFIFLAARVCDYFCLITFLWPIVIVINLANVTFIVPSAEFIRGEVRAWATRRK